MPNLSIALSSAEEYSQVRDTTRKYIMLCYPVVGSLLEPVERFLGC